MNKLSGSKFLWYKPNVDLGKVVKIAKETSFSLPIAEVLVSRSLDDRTKIFDFLFPVISFSEDDIDLMKDARVAVDRIYAAIQKQERILVFGDYDVDGMTSTSIAILALRRLGAQANYYLPERTRDGYGLSTKIVEAAFKNDYKLIITVDNGTTSLDAAALAKKLGVDLIITDHHRPKGELPVALALVNPQQQDCQYPFKYFCGAGVIFKLMSFLYNLCNESLPEKVYELLALGTVADVVPLRGENRHWVNFGLNILNNQSHSFSFQTLAKNVGKDGKKNWKSLDLGFGIAPQLNALGRLSDPKNAIKFLIGSDADFVQSTGQFLKSINEQRKEVEQKVLTDIEAKIRSGKIDLLREHVIIDASPDWPAGVIGLVAGRLTSNYGRPCLLFHVTSEGIAKGSARSMAGFDLFTALGKNEHLLKSFGGHRQAAGLSLHVDNLPQLKLNLEALVAENFSISDLQPSLNIDATLQLIDLNSQLQADLDRLEPFGNENPPPSFLLSNLTLVKEPELLKDKHLKLQVAQNNVIKPVILFNRPDLFEKFALGCEFDLAAQVLQNDFSGKLKLELQGLDVKFV